MLQCVRVYIVESKTKVSTKPKSFLSLDTNYKIVAKVLLMHKQLKVKMEARPRKY